MNQNVLLVFCLRIADGIANGVWNLSVLSTYISVLEGSTPAGNAKVGYVQAIQGTALAAAAIPAGWLGSKYRRDLILKWAGCIELVAIAITCAAILSATHKYLLLCVAVGWWGVAQGYSPVLDALFADSVPTGSRSNIYTTQFICSILSQGLGPAIAALLFWLHGNTWDLQVLQRVMLVGMFMALIPACMLFCFDDRKALGAESEGLLGSGGVPEEQQLRSSRVQRRRSRSKSRAGSGGVSSLSLSESSGSDELRQPLLQQQEQQQEEGKFVGDSTGEHAVRQELTISAVADGVGQQQAQQEQEQQQHQQRSWQQQHEVPRAGIEEAAAQHNISIPAPAEPAARADTPALQAGSWGCLHAGWIPPILAISDIISGLASGMTIKFFPIFFKDEVGLGPMYVNILYCFVPICLSLASFICQRASRVAGRVQAIALFKLTGIILLYIMACLPSIWRVPRLIIPVYLCRTCIMNATYPLQKSIMMDYVPKSARAKWNSLEAVTSFGWSGSAALGGWLIQHWGFDMNFYITASMQLLAWSVMVLLVPLVPRQEGAVVAVDAGGVAGVAGGEESAGERGSVV